MKNSNLLKVFFIIGLLAFVAVGCGRKNQITLQKPTNLIDKSTLSELLIGSYIIESAVYYKSQKGINIGLYTTAYYNALFDKHKVTKKQFYESMNYYIGTDKDISKLFLNVINKLMTMQNTPVNQQQSTGENAPSEKNNTKEK